MLAIISNYAFSKSPCSSLTKCIGHVSELTGEKYTYPSKLDEQKVQFSKNLEITKENADAILSEVLAENGLTKIKSPNGHWSIISARDVRYHSTPTYVYGKDSIPSTFDYVTVIVHLKNKYISSELSRSFRPFMGRYGRIIDQKLTGLIIINDTGINVKRLVKIIEKVDKEPTAKEIQQYEMKARARSYHPPMEAKVEHHKEN